MKALQYWQTLLDLQARLNGVCAPVLGGIVVRRYQEHLEAINSEIDRVASALGLREHLHLS